MTDTTAARRELLALLLDRVERGALLTAEMPLLRALVAAEQDAADYPAWPGPLPDHISSLRQQLTEALTAEHHRRAEQRIKASPEGHSAAMADVALRVFASATADAPWLKAAAEDRADTGGVALRAVQLMQEAGAQRDSALATIDRVRAKVAEWREWDEQETRWAVLGIEQAISNEPEPGPSPMPDDDTPPTRDDGRTTCRIMETRTCPEPYNGPCGDRPCARFESEDPTPWVPDGTPTPVLDALRAGQLVTFRPTPDGARPVWRGPIEGYGTGEMLGLVASGVATPVVTRCSPLVNPNCPGHTDAVRCDRAASHPVTPTAAPASWSDAARCTATIPDHSLANTGVIFQCELDAGHYHPADEPDFTADPPTLGSWHRNGDRNWSDQAEGATPHTEAPTEPQQ